MWQFKKFKQFKNNRNKTFIIHIFKSLFCFIQKYYCFFHTTLIIIVYLICLTSWIMAFIKNIFFPKKINSNDLQMHKLEIVLMFFPVSSLSMMVVERTDDQFCNLSSFQHQVELCQFSISRSSVTFYGILFSSFTDRPKKKSLKEYEKVVKSDVNKV